MSLSNAALLYALVLRGSPVVNCSRNVSGSRKSPYQPPRAMAYFLK